MRNTKTKVFLNVYDLSPLNYYLHTFGIGLYHTGVEIGLTEYYFGYHEGNSSGIATQPPKMVPNEQIKYRMQIYLGDTQFSMFEI